MNIDKKDSERVGRLTVPFILAIFLALLLEDMWEEMALEHQLITVFSLVFIILLIYRKKVYEIMR